MASLEDMINALFESANDKDDSVVEAVFTSLRTIGLNQPETFLLLSHNFLSQQTKISFKHRELILKSMRYVCAENLASISNSTIALVISLSTQEITQSKDSSDDWQTIGSSILVVLSRNHCKTVVDCIMQKFQAGLPFCHIIISTLGEIALTNPFDFCPNLPEVLNRITAMMSTLKTESVRIVSATGVRKLGEAYLEFLASGCSQSHSEVVDPSASFVSIYDHVISTWLPSRDNKLRCANVHMLGVLTNFLPVDRLREETPKLIRMIAPTHWKTTDPVLSIEALCHIIQSTNKFDCQIPDSVIDHLLLCMICQVGASSQVKNVHSLRYQGEVLRFFSYSTKKYQSRLCRILTDKLLSGQEKIRCDVLLIFKHLVNSKSLSIDNGRQILATLRPFLTGEFRISVLVKNYIFYLLVALLEGEYIAPDGSEICVHFMLRQLMETNESGNLGKTNSIPLVQANKKSQFCQSICYLISNVPSTEAIFWPLLFRYLCWEEYTELLDEICKYLIIIAKRMNSTDRLTIEYSNGDDGWPKSHEIFARLLVCLGTPFKKKIFNQNVLELLEQIYSLFFPLLGKIWPEYIKRFHRRLAEENFKCDDRWRKQLAEVIVVFFFKFLTRTLNFVNNHEWVISLAAALRMHFDYYRRHDEAKVCLWFLGFFLFKFKFFPLRRGCVLCALASRFPRCRRVRLWSTICRRFLTIPSTIPLSNRRYSCAEAVGYVAQSHVDIVLTKLENVMKDDEAKILNNVFGFFRDALMWKPSMEDEFVSMRPTVLLCYGYVALNCPLGLLVIKLEHVILRCLSNFFRNVEDGDVLRSLLISMKLIAIAVHPSRIQYKFPIRSKLLHYVMEYVKFSSPEVVYTDLRKLAIEAAIELGKLNPPLNECSIQKVGATFASAVLRLVKVEGNSEMQTLIDDCLLQFNAWLLENLNRNMTINQLVTLLEIFLPCIASKNPIERERAMECCKLLLKHFFDHVDLVLGQALSFWKFGFILGKFAPRMFDSSYHVRVASLECIYWLFAIATANLGHGRCYQDIIVEKFRQHSELLDFSSPDSQARLMESFCEVIEQRMPVQHVESYTFELIRMLIDDQPSVSCAAAGLLKSIVTNKSSVIAYKAYSLFHALMHKFNNRNMCLQAYAEALQAFCEIARHKTTLLLNCLLEESLTFNRVVCDCWRVLSRDSNMFIMVMEYLFEPMESEPDLDHVDFPLTERPTVPLSSVVATAAMKEAIQAKLFATLLLQCARSAGGEIRPRAVPVIGHDFTPYPNIGCGSIAVAAIRALLVRVRLDDVVLALTEADRWDDFDHQYHYPDAIYEVSNAIGIYYPESLPAIFSQLKMFSNPDSGRNRLVLACVLSAFVKFCNSNQELFANVVIDDLMNKFTDRELLIRKMAARGFGNMAHCDTRLFNSYCDLAINSLIAGLEDASDFKDEIAFEAMQGLSKLTAKCMPHQFANVLITVVLAIRPFFEKESGAIRSVAFNLLGNMSRFGTDCKFLEQVHCCMISVLLHLNDEVEDVCTAAAFALQEMVKLLNCEQLTKLSAKANQIGKEITYAEFLKEFASILVSFTEQVDLYALNCSNYFKSASSKMRCNATLFIGYFLGVVPVDLRTNISKEVILSGLIILLKEPEVEVRRAAALAMSYLYAY
ncbi:Maestro heat-like repeat-containing protein family member 1 [Trichinella patagoniensis]|uniref:Maestro heat-like repeat-containing protein family member 1 n=1 Tax=Trichinella patagoniensis TaxID=990121 RepID=A0A0V0ZPN9_9BILA|nr:Maestro heat-like repeat-containing protein family member 1 [Trichinella patagoniensis]